MNTKKSSSILSKLSMLAILTTLSIYGLENNNSSEAIAIDIQTDKLLQSNSNNTLLASNLSTEEQLYLLAELAHQKVNEYRIAKNLPPLETSAAISEQARIHSENMAKGTVEFSHDGFQDRVDTIKNSVSYRSVAENVAFNMGYEDPANKAVEGWIGSTGHRQNMEGNFNLTGIGVAKNQDGEYYFTQIFVLEKE